MSRTSGEIPVVQTPRVVLGHVSAPSGKLVIVDGGLMYLWQHDREPVVPEGVMSDESLREKMNSEVDLAIEGPEARIAGRAFDRQWHPEFLFDIPRDGVTEVREAFEKMVREKNLIARMVELPERVNHRRRVDLAIAQGGGGGEIQFHGVMGAAVAGVPRGKQLAVVGQRMTGEKDKSRWRQVLVECFPELTPVRTELAGYIGVDEARLLIADANAMGAWRHDESLDGKADYVFWGADAAELAEKLGAVKVTNDQYGWIDLAVEEAAQVGAAVERARDEHQLKARGDFRPHSHHYLAMAQVRTRATESGTITVGGAAMTLFMTTWGDGIFEVWRDLDKHGDLVRIRIDLGNERIVERQRRFEELWFGELAKFAFVSKRIMDDHEPVRWLYREPADNAEDSGWRLYSGDEDQEYCDNAANVALVPLRELIRLEKSLEEIFRSPVGAAYERAEASDEFVRVEDWKPPDDEA